MEGGGVKYLYGSRIPIYFYRRNEMLALGSHLHWTKKFVFKLLKK